MAIINTFTLVLPITEWLAENAFIDTGYHIPFQLYVSLQHVQRSKRGYTNTVSFV